ncbi:outer membrane lipoprotein carrier protein LolA [Rummeliibacillus sp. TYF005]|uniref:LolA family protein n=1 Tax=Rummeliibacillus sp. TYF005 TaxID=2058214 RepID=UPI000F535EFC|nr:outer membrane lipoprotein carrier protein LolA [Rummeliibacillus sp. TYF005]RPJ96521.1 outer membrane lipoprotein carrier protein LolA [Rummeliibacillus sp. TYF005]
MRKFLTIGLLCLTAVLLLTACGSNSKEDVVKKTSKKWTAAKGYEVKAVMEIKTTGEAKKYDVDVWHTKPEFYRVSVSEEGQDTSQMIIRNEEGVFVVTPSLKKTYKFQSDWPKQNSQGYLLNALADDLAADKTAEMKETKNAYIFKAKTRNNHSKILPTQQVYINKKTLLPSKVIVLNEANEEQIRITFKKISLGVAKKASDYAVEDFTKSNDNKAETEDAKTDVTSTEETDKEASSGENTNGNTTDDKTTSENTSEEKATEESSSDEHSQSTNGTTSSEESNANTSEETIATSGNTTEEAADSSQNLEDTADNGDFETYYPVLKWDNVKLKDEDSLQMDNGTRKFLSFEGDKSFTIIQEKVTKAEQLYIPVFSPGDPADLGFTIGAITDHSITWDTNGVSFFIASNDLSKEELIEVASSMVNGEVK